MRSNLFIGIALSVVMAILLVSGLALFAMVLFQVPIAYCWLSRKKAMAVGLLCCATLIPMLVTGAPVLGIAFGVLASLGLLLGILAQRRISIGRTVTLLTVALYVLIAGWSIFGWNDIRSDFHQGIEQYKTTLESQTKDDDDEITAITEVFGWFEDNLPYLYFGGLFSSILLLSTAITGAIYRRLRPVPKIDNANYQFIWMRIPEHLVWLAILVAGLWFIDNRWPNEIVRFLAWNGAISLAAIYWINGLSILLFAWRVWKWNQSLLYVFIAFMILFNIIYMLSIFGFFDTWIGFRRRLAPVIPADTPDSDNDSDVNQE